MKVGETLIIQPRDNHGNVIKTVTLVRTEASYAHDLARAYNEAMGKEQRDQGLLWIVSNGTIRLVVDRDWTDKHTRHLKFKAEWGEI